MFSAGKGFPAYAARSPRSKKAKCCGLQLDFDQSSRRARCAASCRTICSSSDSSNWFNSSRGIKTTGLDRPSATGTDTLFEWRKRIEREMPALRSRSRNRFWHASSKGTAARFSFLRCTNERASFPSKNGVTSAHTAIKNTDHPPLYREDARHRRRLMDQVNK